MTPLHGGSLVDPSLHSKATLELVELDISRSLIEYIVYCTVDAVNFALNTPSTSRGRSNARCEKMSSFTDFVSTVINRSEVKMPVLLATLVYITRATPHLSIKTEEWALERVFLGAIILASKYTNDSTLKNVHWALCTGLFGKRDIGRIEREFIDVLDWELSISEADILHHHDSIMTLQPNPHRLTYAFLSKRSDSRTMESSWSDSDDSMSSSDSSCTLASPHQPTYVASPQPPVSSSRNKLVGALHHSLQLPWNGKTNPPSLLPSLPQMPVRV